ncbi:GNAT family N-acetyltransferase [Microbacterium sp. G2-8]|uniref:GNAT family N-acetyltransferase n=1 Tax=Microbacterium sp. G2-8 TaxID=2842454 RepID=UPI001C8A9FF1|nr:GNAT family N-acetyltransferase [Microbacterium sp. G2-8]
MSTITTSPATIADWDDVQEIFAGGGDGRTCQCMWPMMRQKDFSAATTEDLERDFRHEIQSGPPPGLVARIDGAPAGWVRIGPRIHQKRLAHTRGLPAASAHDLDDAGVWALTCFSIPRTHRGQGIMAALLDAAIASARDAGARVIEAYPRDPTAKRTDANSLFVGTLSTFTRAGFEVVAPLGSARHVVQLVL